MNSFDGTMYVLFPKEISWGLISPTVLPTNRSMTIERKKEYATTRVRSFHGPIAIAPSLSTRASSLINLLPHWLLD